jgi:D-glycero-D-manno-heptose 1,7-bisphosphate phosphatase
MSRAAFLDRDGVINRKAREGEYVTRWEEMQFHPGVAVAIALLNQAGFCVIVVSNQRCVAKGLITTADLEAIHQRMCDALAADGATIDAIYYCPHDMQPACCCRKPAPGMLLAAARTHQLNLTASWIIGDSDIDEAAGRNAGCKTARLLSGTENGYGRADVVAPSLLDAVRQILRLENLMADRGAAELAQGSRREPTTPDGARRH